MQLILGAQSALRTIVSRIGQMAARFFAFDAAKVTFTPGMAKRNGGGLGG